MRVSEDRYHRDRQRLQVAVRFLKHNARTQTIRTWTGLTEHRIRKLYGSYLQPITRVPRIRGKSPRQVAYFGRSLRVQQETAWLASLLSLLGVIPSEPKPEGGDALPSLARGKLLCQAFDVYRAMIRPSQISFEHAAFLATTLARGERLRLGTCADCGSLMVTDPLSIRDKRCHHCAG